MQDSSSLLQKIKQAYEAKALCLSTYDNLTIWLKEPSLPDWAKASLTSLIEESAWEELDDRFYKTLSFGTGGMRGRSIAKKPTAAEQGTAAQGIPQHPAVGSNCMNDFNVVRATLGLFCYTQISLKVEKPVLVISYDVRHFSSHFAKLSASVWEMAGGKAFVFEGPRSTPQLSFAVRYLKAQVGVMITASHNPSHDNGYKVYFSDGGQVVFPHAEGIIEHVKALQFSDLISFLDAEPSFEFIEPELDQAYLNCVLESVVDKTVFKDSSLKVVFSPLHGTGGVTSLPALAALAIDTSTVEDQSQMDGSFPTVSSPNPEMPEALKKAMEKAEQVGADIVLATDPDADRMGAAVRNKEGKMVLLTGNSIGSVLAAYRIQAYKKKGWITEQNASKAVIIKTFVTTPLQEAIAKAEGLRVVETLTGFKWIAAKLKRYEEQLYEQRSQEGSTLLHYDTLPLEERAKLLLDKSSWFVFGGEESYGYLGNDAVRDKDANAATLMLCELAASLKKEGKTVPEYLDELYLKHGYYAESLLNVYYEGAQGAQKIQAILDAYATNPPKTIAGIRVKQCLNFKQDVLKDADGDTLPQELFFMLDLENGYRYAVRGSGTEPKIKFYIFGHERVDTLENLAAVKTTTAHKLKAIKLALEADSKARATV